MLALRSWSLSSTLGMSARTGKIARSCAVLLACVSGLAGCASTQITGRVIEGPGNVVNVVASTDPRVNVATPPPAGAEGLGSATVVVRRYQGEGSTGAILASGVSNPDGTFRIPLPNSEALRSEMVVIATTADKKVSRGRFFVPGEGRQLLVIVRE